MRVAFLKTLQRIGESLHGMSSLPKNPMKRDFFDEFILSKKMNFRLFFVVFFYSEGF